MYNKNTCRNVLLLIILARCRGVLQTLVEKHFPAPDRNRIQRLLGLEPPKLRLEDDDMDGASGSAGGSKRKPVRQAAQRASKKVRAWSSEEEITDEERNGAHSSGSEFKLSGSESEDDHPTDEESNISSDFNPFFSDSDSDTGKFRFRKLSRFFYLITNHTRAFRPLNLRNRST